MHGAGGGAPRGNRNAWKHGGYSGESIALRRHIAEVVRAARQLARPSNDNASSLAKKRIDRFSYSKERSSP
jgi:hypothetical protein